MTGTAVATAPAEKEDGVGQLPEAIRHQLKLRKLENIARAELAKLSWGASLDLQARGTIAEWGRVYNVDVTQEIDLLGGRVYLNARYYLRRLAELVETGRVVYAYADHIHDDPRLKELGKEGDAERLRRLKERIKHNAPDKATAVVVFRVQVRDMGQEVVGVNWAGGGSRGKDPVGDAEPVKTAESRAARRCMRLLVGHVKEAEAVEAVVEATGAVEEVIQRSREANKVEIEYARTHRLPSGAGEPDDVYGKAAPPKVEVIDMAAKPTPRDLFAGEPNIYEPGDAAEPPYQAEPGDARD